MKKTTLPPEEIDGEITIWGYYKENEEAISERFYRKAESTRNGYLSCMSGTLCEITSTVLAEAELSDMQLLMNQLIVAKRHTGKEYSRARVDTFQYLIYTTFLFATEKKKIMFNPLWGTSWGKHSSDPDTKKKKTKGLNEERKEKQPKRNDKKAEKGCRKCLKSLTLEQEVLLTKYIKENHKKEGMLLGLALMDLCGNRTSEACARKFKDIKVISDSCWSLAVYSQIKNNKDTLRLKTSNAYRLVPIIDDMKLLLEERIYFLEQVGLYTRDQIDEMYISCCGDKYEERTSPNKLSALGRRVLKEIGTDEAVLTNVSEELKSDYCEIELLEQEKMTIDNEAPAYLLRHNFSTYLHGVTGLSDIQIKYVIGHSMTEGERNDFVSKDMQCEMHSKMNHRWAGVTDCPIIDVKATEEEKTFNNVGTVLVKIDGKYREPGENYKLKILVTTNEPNDVVNIWLRNGISTSEYEDNGGGISHTSFMLPSEELGKQRPANIDNLYLFGVQRAVEENPSWRRGFEDMEEKETSLNFAEEERFEEEIRKFYRKHRHDDMFDTELKVIYSEWPSDADDAIVTDDEDIPVNLTPEEMEECEKYLDPFYWLKDEESLNELKKQDSNPSSLKSKSKDIRQMIFYENPDSTEDME